MLRAGLAVLLASGFWGIAGLGSARAACQPNPVNSNDIVTCSGTDTAGISNAAADNVTVTVQTGATIDVSAAPGSLAIQLRDFNAITNFGSILGSGGWGVYVNDGTGGYKIINAGRIDLGSAADGVGIQVNNDYTVDNSGNIRVGSNGTGIVGVDRNTITNSGTIIATGTGKGISVGDRNVVSNSGTIEVGNGGIGIDANDGSTTTTGRLTNSGTITGGDNAVGIRARSNYGITNSGGLSLGANGVGIGYASTATTEVFDNNAVTNSGPISVGSGGVGIGIKSLSGTFNFAGGGGRFTNNTITNNDTITAGANGVGIGIAGNSGTWDSNTIKNYGTVTAGANGVGIGILGTPDPAGTSVTVGTLENYGTVRVGANGISLGSTSNSWVFYATSPASAILNAGTLDGRINLPGTANVDLTNRGLITITDSGTAVGAQHKIGGAYTQQSAGTLALRVTRDNTVFDSLSANDASLAGTLRAVVQAGLYNGSTVYASVIASTCGCTGNFDQAVASSPFFSASSAINGNNIDLTLTRIGFNAVSGLTQNQTAVGTTLEPLYSTSLTGNAATFFSNLLAATSTGALDAISGEGTTGTQTAAFQAGSQLTSTIFGQIGSWLTGGAPGTGGAFAYAQAEVKRPPAPFGAADDQANAGGWRVWFGSFLGRLRSDGELPAGSASSSATSGGGALGIERRFGSDAIAGLSIGGSTSSFWVSDRATNGDLIGGHIGVFGAKTWGALYAAGSLNYARFDNSTSRTISGVGTTEFAKGRFASDLVGGRFELGYRVTHGRAILTPFVAVEPAHLWQHAYTETSLTAAGASGILGLSYSARGTSSLPLFVGAQAETRFVAANGAIWWPFLRAAWVHEFMPERSIEAAFLSVPNSIFTVQGARAARDSARINAGARWLIAPAVSVYASLDTEFSARTTSYSGNLGFKSVW